VCYGAAGLLVLGVWYSFAKKPAIREYLRLTGAIATILLLFGATLRACFYDWPAYYRINLLAMGLALLAPGLYLLADRRPNRAIFLYFMGCMLSVATQIGSNTRILAASGMLLPASAATALYLFDNQRALFCFHLSERKNGSENAGSIRWFRAFAVVSCALFAMALFALRLTTIYRDESIEQLDTAIASGAAMGIFTTQESAEAHDRLVADIRDNAPQEGAILITKLFPEGYMLTDLYAATPSAYSMHMDSEWLQNYYKANPQRRPAMVFAIDPGWSYNDSSMEGSELYENDASYEKRILPSGIAYCLRAD